MIGYNPSQKSSGVNWRHVSAGAVSGCFTRFLCQPFDVIKIRFQLQLEPINRKSVVSKYRSIPQSVATIVTEEGLTALWKAHLCAQLLSIIYGMIQFSSFELYTQTINSSALMKNSKQQEFMQRHQPLVHLLCGSMSGISATLVAHPFDVIRTRIIAQSEPKTYTSTPNAFQTIVRLEGFRGLFRGLLPTLMQIAPFTGIQFTVYNISINFWEKYLEHHNHYNQSDNMERLRYFEKTLCCGAVSGLAAKMTVYPLDLIKKRLQVEGFQSSRKGFGAVTSYNGTIDCVLKTLRQENIFAFYKGLTPSLLKSAITTALNFSVYENVFKFLSTK